MTQFDDQNDCESRQCRVEMRFVVRTPHGQRHCDDQGPAEERGDEFENMIIAIKQRNRGLSREIGESHHGVTMRDSDDESGSVIRQLVVVRRGNLIMLSVIPSKSNERTSTMT